MKWKRFQDSGYEFSGSRFLISGFGFQVSSFEYSGSGFLVSDFWFLASDGFRVSNFEFQISDLFGFQVSGEGRSERGRGALCQGRGQARSLESRGL